MYHEDRTHLGLAKVGLRQFALTLRARLNPSRDSAGCTIVMQWQRRVRNHSSGGQTLFLVTHLWRLSFFASMVADRPISLRSQLKARAEQKKIRCMSSCRATIWRTTAVTVLSRFVRAWNLKHVGNQKSGHSSRPSTHFDGYGAYQT